MIEDLLGVSLLRSLGVANCVRVYTSVCSVVHALVIGLKFDRRKQRCLPKEASQ